MKTIIAIVLITCLTPVALLCHAQGPENSTQITQQRGTVVKLEALGTMDQQRLRVIAAEFPGAIEVRNAASLFRITYWTRLKGRPVEASGLLAIPVDRLPPKGVVMYLHGSNATRALAPSQPDRVDGNEETAVFGGNGYYVVLPDYIGLGVSPVPHPYLVTRPQVDASIDLLRAVRKVVAAKHLDWSPNLFMMGFSQGGQVVAGVHRALEQAPLRDYRLKGSVGIAGPYDLRASALPKALENACRQCVGYLAWATYAYADYYGHPLGEIFKPEFVEVVPRLFDGSKSAAEIGSALPQDPGELFLPHFLQTMRAGTAGWFARALAENETYAWAPVAPFRLHFGDRDVDVPPSASGAFYRYARARGGNISLRSVGPVDHHTSASLVYSPTLKWFDQLAKPSAR